MKKIFSMIALLLMTAVGAMAQTYNVTVKEGTEDATNWSATPNPAEAGQTVTITYSGTKKVKSVKAVKKTRDVPVSSVAINNAPAEALFVNSTGTLTATVLPDNATDKTVTWTSSAPSYVSINATTGEYKVEGTSGYGSATITATAGDKTATCTITGKVTYTSATIGVGTIFHVGDTYYADGTTKNFHAKSNFNFINSNGVITLVIDSGVYKFKRGSNGTMIDLGINATGSSDGVYIASGAGTSGSRFEIAVHTP